MDFKAEVDRFKKFTLQQANALIPELTRLTERTMEKLEQERAKWQVHLDKNDSSAEAAYHQRVNALLREWAERVTDLGVMPKGFFTCDFISPNPERLFCWNFGEPDIAFTHKKTESFKDRIPLEYPELQGFEVSLN